MNKKKSVIALFIILILIAIVVVTIVLINIKNKENPTYEPQVEINNSLSQSELEKFKEFFEEKDNNGFLLSEYSKPIEIDLRNVLYNGSDNAKVTEEEVIAYSEALNLHRDEWWHLFCYPKEEIESLYKEKTGSDDIGDLNIRLYDWTYLPEYDRYYNLHSDSNYTKVNCIEGTKNEDNTYTIKVQLLNAGYNKIVQVTVKEQNGSYIFVSNKYI